MIHIYQNCDIKIYKYLKINPCFISMDLFFFTKITILLFFITKKTFYKNYLVLMNKKFTIY